MNINSGVGLYLLLLLMVVTSVVTAQTQLGDNPNGVNWKLWTGPAVDFTFTKKLEFSLNYQRSYDLKPEFRLVFTQSAASFQYDFTRYFSLKAGVIGTEYLSTGNRTHRYFIRTTINANLGKKISWSNGIQVEKHSCEEYRYDFRFIYITRLGLKKRIPFMKLAPSVSYWIYYNLGGNPIQYYNSLGEASVKQTPDGLHRGRLIININSKITKWLSISTYYLHQNEFNLVGTERGLNVVNPSNGKITRPFNEYNVIGLSLKFNTQL